MTEQEKGDETARDLFSVLADLSGVWTKQAREITETFRALREKHAADAKKIREAFTAINADWQPLFAEFRKHQQAKKALRETSGLLPHATTPWQQFSEDNPALFGPAVVDFYKDSWDAVEAKFRFDLEEYDVSDEAKRAMLDALTCHRHELFRSVVLTLLPYVEMEFRKAFQIEVGGNAASLQELRSMVWKMPAGIVLSHAAPMDLFEILNAHLYDKVKTAEDLSRFQADQIPNRHAAIHGLIEYKSHQNSMNTLILADYVFFIISQLRKHSAA
ncbi:hypothetical protein D1822_03400 [Phaeobacter inhibens]|uniref:hypothetical protein n=1 Tax=Phaeobacter inhibens TaxID=221822 RepID=UPI00016328CE|nr:hypothetical protein [Phaeobacter inhibens]AFO90415.1 hypothetical protein PGA1_c06870 [Phaeobacter inhibens DSM 17395]AUQ45064.1 hypothetical protein PhaeoP10_00700 [Phaeobacter inhibens]AXT21939.1 hypothetical protein D1822_03400 [Phaeobacter inhibens]